MAREASLNRRQLMAGAAAISVANTASPLKAAEAASEPDLSGKSVLITGCSSGFGRIGAEYYAERGAKVIATMRTLPRPEADELTSLAKRKDLDIHVVEIDVLSDTQVSDGVAQALDLADGSIDVLINNAGIGVTGPVEVHDMSVTQLAFDTNVFGCLRMVRAVLPSMRKAGEGQIFSISSVNGRVVVPGAGHYPATKFALEATSEQLAYELVPHNIDVTIIQPGAYPTKIWKNRNEYTRVLRERTSKELADAYPSFVNVMGEEDGSGRTADPLDVPRAIAEIMSMPAGKRPLRKPVHPTMRPQEVVNDVMADMQLSLLGDTPYGALVRPVLE